MGPPHQDQNGSVLLTASAALIAGFNALVFSMIASMSRVENQLDSLELA